MATDLPGWDPLRVRARFGSFRGMVRLALSHVDTVTGRTRALRQVRWDEVEPARDQYRWGALDAAVANAERFYPAFQLATWGERDIDDAMQIAITEAFGRA